MKDYSNHTTKYAIIDWRNMFAIVEVNKRSIDDESEVVSHKPDTLSLSKSISTLQKQINDMVRREETRMEQIAQEEWRASLMRERLAAK